MSQHSNLKMAPYVAEVSVSDLGDPSEVRPKDDQAIVFEIQRDVLNKEYILELNKFVKDDSSFLYISRISRDRLCVVLKDAAQAAMLVEDVGYITVRDFKTQIHFLVAKSVKVNISNASYNVSNTALKRYLTALCKIRTASSVKEHRVFVEEGGKTFVNAKSYRRVIYIHPEDVSKLPSGPVKFITSGLPCNVFFDVDSPKCFLCGLTDHFRRDCPKNNENHDNNDKNIHDLENSQDKQTSPNSKVNNTVNKGKESEVLLDDEIIDAVTADSLDSQLTTTQLTSSPTSRLPTLHGQLTSTNSFADAIKNNTKRPRSNSTSQSESSIPPKLLEANLYPFDNMPPPLNPAPRKSKKVNLTKKIKTAKMNEQDRSLKASSLLEPARAHIEASNEQHHLSYSDVAKLLAFPQRMTAEDRRKRVRSATKYIPELEELLKTVYTLVAGKGIKSKITLILKALNDDSVSDADTDGTLDSGAEMTDASQESLMDEA